MWLEAMVLRYCAQIIYLTQLFLLSQRLMVAKAKMMASLVLMLTGINNSISDKVVFLNIMKLTFNGV